jgi:type IV fimbrial biogenesis protein FimT
MLIDASRRRGFTLIELMVTITLVGIMLVLAVPGFGRWTSNARVRTVSEELQNALRSAQSEAVTRNRQVAFVRTAGVPAANATPSASGSNWYIQVLPLTASEGADTTFQADAFLRGGTFSNADRVTVGGDALLCFNSVGRLVNNTSTGLGANCVAPTSAVDPRRLNVSLTSSDRAMRVEAYLGGRLRMCDPAAPTTQPNMCS